MQIVAHSFIRKARFVGKELLTSPQRNESFDRRTHVPIAGVDAVVLPWAVVATHLARHVHQNSTCKNVKGKFTCINRAVLLSCDLNSVWDPGVEHSSLNDGPVPVNSVFLASLVHTFQARLDDVIEHFNKCLQVVQSQQFRRVNITCESVRV